MNIATAPATDSAHEHCALLAPHVEKAVRSNRSIRKLRGRDPEDIYAAVMMKAFIEHQQGRTIHNPKGWAEVAVRHEVINAFDRSSETEISMSRSVVARGAGTDAGLEHRLIEREPLALLMGLLSTLDAQERELFRQHVLENLSSRQLADRHGIPYRTIARQLAAIREHLAAGLEKGELSPELCEELILYSTSPEECSRPDELELLVRNHVGAAAICRDAASAYKGAAVCLPPAGLGEQHTGLLERAATAIADLRDRAFGNADSAAEIATTLATSGGARGAGGATGGGLLAALAGGGTKVAAICAGGAATVACASAVGVLPAAVDPFKGGEPAQVQAAEEALPSAAESAIEQARTEAAITAATDELAEANRENAAAAKAERKQERRAEAKAEQQREEARAERKADQAAAEAEEFSPLGTSSASTTPSSTGTVTETSDSAGTVEAGETKAPTPAQEEEFGRP